MFESCVKILVAIDDKFVFMKHLLAKLGGNIGKMNVFNQRLIYRTGTWGQWTRNFLEVLTFSYLFYLFRTIIYCEKDTIDNIHSYRYPIANS